MRRICLFIGMFVGLACLLLIATAQPVLNVARQSTNVVVSWPTNETNFVLQQTPALSSPTVWTNFSQTPVVSNGIFVATISPTNDTLFFRLLLASSNLVDEPDDDFIDSNEDGIDGDVTKAIFVSMSGNDGSPGTMAQPMKTIAAAVQQAATQQKSLYVSAGIYTSGTVSVREGVSIYGGYNAVDWSRANNFIAQLSVTNRTGVMATNISNTTKLDHLTIQGGNASGAGGSAYGIFATNSPGLVVRQCSVQSGNASAGTAGSDGTTGNNGGNGGQGNPGCENSIQFCSSCNHPAGGLAGTSSCGRTGGVGGQPGGGNDIPAATGGSGTGGTLGGPGATCFGSRACDGTKGFDGTNGVAGSDGASGAMNFLAIGFTPSNGGSGTGGTDGNGGGGGGGGGGGVADCDSYGSSGGGGGAGGCGGTRGIGGQSGGGSFAIYLWNSSALIESCNLTSGNGGNGGHGGTGGSAGTGGSGGPGGLYGGSGEQDDGGDGAPGGKGGNGGRGGHGGGGLGGPSVGIATLGGSAPQFVSLTFTLGTGGAGGTSAGNAGQNGIAQNIHP